MRSRGLARRWVVRHPQVVSINCGGNIVKSSDKPHNTMPQMAVILDGGNGAVYGPFNGPGEATRFSAMHKNARVTVLYKPDMKAVNK